MYSYILISEDPGIQSRVSRSLSGLNYTMYPSEISTLLPDIYRHNVKFIILDLDSIDLAEVSAVENLREFSYLPVLGLTGRMAGEGITDMPALDHIVPKEGLESYLPPLCRNIARFKAQYDRLRNAYESIDTVNNQVDSIVQGFFRKVEAYDENMVSLLLERTYAVLDNQPRKMILAYTADGARQVDIYSEAVSPGEAGDGRHIILQSRIKDDLSLLSYGHEVFFNLDDENISDIDNINTVFSHRLQHCLGGIKSFAGFSTADFTCIGVNFKCPVVHADAIVIKSMCISLNLLKGIFRGINEINEAVLYTIEALARAGEANDQDTGNHIRRVNEYSRYLAAELGLDSDFINKISYSAQLHDVGKIHIPTAVLNKRGSLSTYEFDLVKSHTVYGAMIIGEAPYLSMARQIAMSHHERYKGGGYPEGISGESIPLPARIVALADIYDALRSPRSYKPPYSHEHSSQIISSGDGRVMPEFFDPAVLDVFARRHQHFEEIFQALI